MKMMTMTTMMMMMMKKEVDVANMLCLEKIVQKCDRESERVIADVCLTGI